MLRKKNNNLENPRDPAGKNAPTCGRSRVQSRASCRASQASWSLAATPAGRQSPPRTQCRPPGPGNHSDDPLP